MEIIDIYQHMIKLPINGKWEQTNTSDKFGSLSYTKNVNLDEYGYVSLSPRTVDFFDDATDTTNVADVDFNVVTAIGVSNSIASNIVTTDEPFNLTITAAAKTIAEDASSDNPNLTFDSHGCWFQNKFLESTSTAVYENDNGTWTANIITGLTSGRFHYLAVFKNLITIAVANGNVVKQYDSSYVNTTDLTLPADYEVNGMAYNNERMGIITRPADSTLVVNNEAYFYTWDGLDTTPNNHFGIGTTAALAVAAYQSSFVILTENGRLLYFNGGGFQELASFPYYVNIQDFNGLAYGDILQVNGDVILINLGIDLNGKDKKAQSFSIKNPSGIWCYDPKVGLYHKYSASISRAYFHSIAQASINLTTDIITTSSSIATNGSPVVIQSSIGGLKIGQVYYVNKLTSTTFRICSTRQNALDGQYIDITSADTNNYLYMYDLIDYGQSYYNTSGAITRVSPNILSYTSILFGVRGLDSSLNSLNTLNTAVLFLENRGYIVTSKIFTNNKEEGIDTVTIKHKPLNTNDSILVKIKTKDYVGIPTIAPNSKSGGGAITWASTTSGTTVTDLSEAKTAFDGGEELELELISGVGAGQMTKITGLTESSGTYTITTEDEIVGASSGLKSYFCVDNWKLMGSVDFTSQKEGIFNLSIGKQSRAPQFKIELRGFQTTIEDILIANKSSNPTV